VPGRPRLAEALAGLGEAGCRAGFQRRNARVCRCESGIYRREPRAAAAAEVLAAPADLLESLVAVAAASDDGDEDRGDDRDRPSPRRTPR
jgi:hypothetical protein